MIYPRYEKKNLFALRKFGINKTDLFRTPIQSDKCRFLPAYLAVSPALALPARVCVLICLLDSSYLIAQKPVNIKLSRQIWQFSNLASRHVNGNVPSENQSCLDVLLQKADSTQTGRRLPATTQLQRIALTFGLLLPVMRDKL
jgi:hypothetical protein